MTATTHTKIAVPLVVLALCAVALTGAVYAYSAIYNDTTPDQPISEEYVVISGTDITMEAQNLSAVWNTTSKHGQATVWTNGHFVKDLGTATGETITTVTYDLCDITVTKYKDGTASAVRDLTASNFELVAQSTGTAVSAVKEFSITVTEQTEKPGTYDVSVTFTLVSLKGADGSEVSGYEHSKSFVIPAYNLTVTYEVAEKTTA